MANEDNRFYVNACIEIYFPDQGCCDKANTHEQRDAEWLANEIS